MLRGESAGKKKSRFGIAVAMMALIGLPTSQSMAQTKEAPQIVGDTANTSGIATVKPLVTIGEQTNNGKDFNEQKFGYRPPGILDGIGAFSSDDNGLRVLVNHELNSDTGYAYTLANSTELTGARVSYFDINTKNKQVTGMGLAYDRIFDRAGEVVTSGKQINENGSDTDGFDRFCSAYGIRKEDGNFTTDLFFTGEETGDGQEAVIDVVNKDLYVVPMLGRAAWENITVLDTKGTNKVALMIGDDTAPAPLWLYIGEKGSAPAGGSYDAPNFLKNNGLGNGNLYVWVADNSDTTPQQFNGTGESRNGKFVKIMHFDPTEAGNNPDYDSLGFVSYDKQTSLADDVNAFLFSRPEDVATNPADGTQVIMASTGRGSLYPADNWGTIYKIDVVFTDGGDLSQPLAAIDNISASIEILYDGDDAGGGQFPGPDFGIRSPDNLDWAKDGYIYVQEDRSTSPSSDFGGTSGVEASAWQLNPNTGEAVRILEMDRSAVPLGQSDPQPFDIGNWESSGVLDVTEFFGGQGRRGNKTVLIIDTQAHSLQGGGLAEEADQNDDLVQGSQLLLVEVEQ